MSDLELFKKLAERFDTDQIVGAPMTKSLLKILMLLFNPEEAEIAPGRGREVILAHVVEEMGCFDRTAGRSPRLGNLQ